ncbi:uncharacterized protein LOC122087095 isoform X2 [Macadamia integrifolia]|uniref:uncharacterized protein LOC122087095 isoform X2 n=1 Tax=Macadamia integrifolia TaxID=60698 RepID=UPI001C4F5FF0|nr:uncharacterized protein LOC122087095 isoform X2 [Macadamia integrifolia]
MTKLRERNLRELYGVTDLLTQPEITPVLKGSFRIQGPVDEGDLSIQTHTGSSQAEKRFGRHSPSENVQMKVESGTCNVCSAPCSSCMHFNRAVSFMASKTEDEFSDETFRGKANSRCSFNDAAVLTPKSRACNDQQPTASETSNLLSTSSSHDSFSENAQSKILRTFETSEDVKMLPKHYSAGMNGQDLPIPKTISGQRAVISASSHIASNLDRRTFSNQDQEQKGSDCHGDNISCVSGANDADLPNVDHNVDMERKNVSCCSASVCSYPLGIIEKKVNVHNASGSLSDFPCEMEESHNDSRPDAKDLEENSVSHFRREPSECSMEHMESSLDRVVINDGVAGQKNTACNSGDIPLKLENSKPSLVRSASSVSLKVYPCLEAEVAIPENEALKCLEKNEPVETSSVSVGVADTQDPPVQSQPIDESDGSDILEDDVKVCDICGDAGREEMLAFCCRCSDGAEHTYCMRIMLDKVPEGDWLCEECKLKEETEKQNLDKLETASGTSKASCLNGKDNSGGEGIVCSKLLSNSDVKESKLDVKDSDTEGTKVGSCHLVPAKRQSDNIEVASAAKRQVYETSVGSPTTSSPGRKAALSRDSSFKNLDKGKVKPSQPIPFSGNHTANNSQDTEDSPTISCHNLPRIQSRLQSPRGTLLKSNSFSTSSAKPKVKWMQEDVSPKKKLAKEVYVNDPKKQGIAKAISKSMSFKTTLTGRSNATEAKVKMLPSNFNRTEDLKGIKQAKERTLVERKSSFKLDRPLVSSTTALSSLSNTKDDQKTTSRAETMPSLSSAANYHDLKAVQPDGKWDASVKPISLLGKRGPESTNAMAGFGECKRPTSSSSALGALSSNGKGTSVELKPRQVVPKEEPISSSTWNTYKSGSKPDVIMQDGLPQSRESTNQEGRTREPPISRSRPVGGKKIRCNKCKEITLGAHCCPIGSPRDSVFEASSPRSSWEVMGKSTKLKEAVEASVMKKPGLYKKNKLGDQSDELSMSSTDLSCEVVPKDQLSTSSSCLRNLNSGKGTNDGWEIIGSPATDSIETISVIDVKQHVAPPTEALCISKAAELDAAATSNGNKTKTFMRESHILASPGASQSQFSAIPEHDYIWQGSFEVQRSGMLPELCDGIQAHLSTRASPKVLEVVNKFPSKVQMEEVPRLSAWPLQFQELPATEDNIALYFFAKDLESYERSYKSLLNNMIKNDLAFKGNFNSIELLVFPSFQLPEKSQRWNMLFFFWGVFRGRRVNYLERIPVCENKLLQAISDVPLDQDSSGHVMSVSQINCSSGQMDEHLSSFIGSSGAQQAAKSTVSSDLLFSGGVDLNCEAKVSSPDRESLDFKSNFDEHNSGLNASPLSRVLTDVQCTELKSNGLPLVEQIDLESKPDGGLQPTVQVNRQNGSFIKGKMVSTGLAQCGSSIDGQDTLSLSKTLPVDTSHTLGVVVRNTGNEKIQERINDHSRDQVTVQNKVKDERMVDLMLPVDTSHALGVGVRNTGNEKIQERINDCNRDQVTVQNKVKDERMVDLSTACVEITANGPVEKECSSWWEFFNRKCLHPEFSHMVSRASGETSTARSRPMPWKEKECVLVDGESETKQATPWEEKMASVLVEGESEKKVKHCFSEAFVCSSSKGQSSSSASSAAHIHRLPGFPVKEQRYDGAHEDVMIPENLRAIERHFFPMDFGPVRDDRLGSTSVPWKAPSSGDDLELEFPNLELALGPKQGRLALFGQTISEANNNDKCLESLTKRKDNVDNCDSAASLALSLAFPISEKEHILRPVSRTEQILPERHQVNTSLLLFRSSSDT